MPDLRKVLENARDDERRIRLVFKDGYSQSGYVLYVHPIHSDSAAPAYGFGMKFYSTQSYASDYCYTKNLVKITTSTKVGRGPKADYRVLWEDSPFVLTEAGGIDMAASLAAILGA